MDIPPLVHEHDQSYRARHRQFFLPTYSLAEICELIERTGLQIPEGCGPTTIHNAMNLKKPNVHGALMSGHQLEGHGTRQLPEGVYLSEDDAYALCVGGGKGIGFQLRGNSYGVVQDMAGVIMDKSWPGGIAWRQSNNLNKNTKAQAITLVVPHPFEKPPSIILATAQFMHRKYLADRDTPVVHTEGWLTVDVERKKREALLHTLACSAFGAHAVRRCLRLAELDRLELDIYIPHLKLAIEHQGQQHYMPIAAWGGAPALAITQEHDARKRKLCAESAIRLIEWRFDEPISEGEFDRRVLGFVRTV